MNRIGKVLFLGLLGWAVSMPVGAADIGVDYLPANSDAHGEGCVSARINLRGDIVEGDADKVAKALSEVFRRGEAKGAPCGVNDSSLEALVHLDLASEGGSYAEALKIADIIRKPRQVAGTYVGAGASCLGACAVVFIGGTTAAVDDMTVVRRVIHPTAKLGFNAPMPAVKDDSYSAAQVNALLQQGAGLFSRFLATTRETGITSTTLQRMLGTERDAYFMVDTVGTALMTGTAVSDAMTFRTYHEGPRAVGTENVLNICYNHRLQNTGGDQKPLAEFLSQQKAGGEKPYRTVDVRTAFFGERTPGTVYLVPIEAGAEGSVQQCVVLVTRGSKSQPARSQCIGIQSDSGELLDVIKKKGVDSGLGDYAATCREERLSFLKWDLKLKDLPPEVRAD